MVTLLDSENYLPLASKKLYCLVTEGCVCLSGLPRAMLDNAARVRTVDCKLSVLTTTLSEPTLLTRSKSDAKYI